MAHRLKPPVGKINNLEANMVLKERMDFQEPCVIRLGITIGGGTNENKGE